MLKLRLNSSPTSTTALTLSEEYDEIQKANIFPTVQEDQSVTSRTSVDMSATSSGSANNAEESPAAPPAPSASVVEDLKAEIESLRQQLAERDLTVNELHNQIQEDKRAHDKLQTRWDLFFGSDKAMSSSSMSMSTRRLQSSSTNSSPASDSTTLSPTDMLKLTKHMDQLEEEKEACVQKTIKLAVALAESKAKCSTLESQVEEMQNIILIQNKNCSPLGFLSGGSTTPSTSTHGFPLNKSTHSTTPASASASSAGKGKVRRRASMGGVPPPMDSFLAVSEIQLNDDSHNSNSVNMEQQGHVSISLDDECESSLQQNSHMERERDFNDIDSCCFSLESESLGWSGRPMSYLSERSNRSDRGASRSASMNTTTTPKGGSNPLAKGLREFRNMISTKKVEQQQMSYES